VSMILLTVDGREIPALEGQLLGGVLVGAGLWSLRRNLVSGEPRGPFCGMGVCAECELTVDDSVGVRACQVRCHDGMTVRSDG
jgi:hypothetical protein